ncbi:MAG TPA: hypothetical protein PLP19_01690 [bacterium]|nr:hypothetical protein [bacterium]HPN42178.1 hypothetical protein [bacterium]
MKRFLLQPFVAVFLPCLLLCACHPVDPVLKLQAAFPPFAATRSYSLLDSLAVGAGFEMTGIYERLAAGGKEYPVLRVFDNRYGAGYAFLQEPVRVPFGTLIAISGYIIQEPLSIKPQQVKVNKVSSRNVQVLTGNEGYLDVSRRVYKRYLPQLQQFNIENNIALRLQEEPEWRFLYDGKKHSMISYMVHDNGIYGCRLELVFSARNTQVTAIDYYTFFKGE